MQTFENLLLQNYSTVLVFLDIAQKYSLGTCVIKDCSNGDATYIISKIIVKDNLNLQQI